MRQHFLRAKNVQSHTFIGIVVYTLRGKKNSQTKTTILQGIETKLRPSYVNLLMGFLNTTLLD